MHDVEIEKVRHLYEKGLFDVPYYQERIGSGHIFDSYESFRKIPFMVKSDLRRVSPFNRSTTPMGKIHGVFSSSGTTGKKTFYIYNKCDKRVHEKFVRTYFSHIGINEYDLGAILGPVGSDVMTNTMMWQYTTIGAGYTVCPNPSPQNVLDLVESVPITVISTRPDIASLPYYDQDVAPQLANKSVRILALGGGFISRSRRAMLEDLWGAECFNLFGMSEMFGPMAAECSLHNGFHYLNDYLLVEVVDPDTGVPVAPGQPGVAVYTTLWEKGFPLLRYWTDDYVVVDQGPCQCGWQLPRIYYLGRLGDCMRADHGLVFPCAVEDVLYEHGFKGEYQIDIAGKSTVVVRSERIDGDLALEGMTECLEDIFKSRDVRFEIVDNGSIDRSTDRRRFRVIA